jgi:hypothetical protein
MALRDDILGGTPGWAAPAHEIPAWAAPAAPAMPTAAPIAQTRTAGPAAPGKMVSYAAPLQAGLAAGQSAGPVFDGTEAAVSIGSSTLAGAASGALAGASIGAMGGPIGAGVGAAVGAGAALLTSGVNSWLSLRANKRKRRALEAMKKEAEEREKALAADQAKKDAYAARLQALQGAAAAYQQNAASLQNMMVNNIKLRNLYLGGQ